MSSLYIHLEGWEKKKRILTSTISIHIASVLAAEIDIGDEALVREVGAHVALGVGEVGEGGAPRARVGALVGDVVGDARAAERPHADALVAPLDGHDATLIIIIGGAVAVGVAADAAARVFVGGVVAVLLEDGAAHNALHAHPAVVRRVQRHLVPVRRRVHRLHDVDLAVVRPVVRVRQPERRPRPAPHRRVPHVEDEQALAVLRLRLEADREPPRRRVR